jgi:pimeloyl-ACP methyl ester carboxylesterase
MKFEPFTVRISEQALADLNLRLERTRWADDFANEGWDYGTNAQYLRELVAYWRRGYDWRQQEAQINRWPQFRTDIDGVPIHFLRARGVGPAPIPLMLNHGWPWTFWDFQKVIGPLSDPAAYGGDAADAFEVIVPSLPGHGFSTPLRRPGINFWRTADLWVLLMEALGYPRFATHGGDWGSFISAQLGHRYADRLIGVHLSMMAPLDFATGGGIPREDYAPEEQSWAQRTRQFFREGSGYFALQTTRPQTLSYALHDSPVGLCAWILEKRRAWSDCDGRVESRFSKDDLLTNVMLYWLTDSFITSGRYYYEAVHQPWRASHDRLPVVQAPTGIAVFLKEIMLRPRRWAERYYNLQRWTVYPSGGHFAPMEEPQALIEDIRAFFRPLRSA